MSFKYILSGFLLVLVFSCENLEDLNENPNQPTDVGPDVLMTSAIRSTMNSMVTESFLLGNNAAQLTAKTLRSEIDVYNWNPFPTVWTSLYDGLEDVANAERLAREEEDAATEGAAVVLKSWLFSTLTDAYGDIPYTEAVSGGTDGNFQPVYDTQQDIYMSANGILAELERANNLLAQGGIVQGDILLGGSAEQWRKLCNSLRLRLLMRISNRMDVASDFADIVNNEPIIASNDDNAVLNYLESFPNDFPLLPLKQGDFDAVVMSDRSIPVLEGYRDPRLMRYARPNNIVEIDTAQVDTITPVYTGAQNGAETTCSKGGSRLGLAYFDYGNHPTTDDHADGILMTYAEVQFLLAEAVLKNFISGNVEQYYRSGIQASMDYYEVDYEASGWTDFDDFYNNSGVAFANDPIQVWEQKWLALFFHGLEPYFEVRRWLYEVDNDWNQIPFLSPPCDNVNNDMLPVRFLYPGEEASLNGANYQAAVGRLEGGDDQNAKMWLVQ